MFQISREDRRRKIPDIRMEEGGAAVASEIIDQEEIIAPRPSGKLDAPYVIMLLVLLALGLVCLFSASYSVAYHDQGGDSTYFVTRQAAFAVFGLGLMYLLSKLDYHKWVIFALPIFVGTIILLSTIFYIPSMWVTINYATRWIDVFGITTFQPSELAKFSLIILLSAIAAIAGPKQMQTFKYGVLPFAAVIGITVLFIFPEKHFSAIAIIGAIGLVIMFLGGAKLGYFFAVGGVGVLGVIGLIAIKGEHVITRLKVWLDPFQDAMNAGWQGVQAQIAVGSGGFWGLGLGQSRQKHLYLPEPANDFIFAVMCEEFGFLITSLIVILFGLFIWRGYYIAAHASDRLGTLLAAGITTHLAVQIIINLFVVTGLFPITGASLPFFSSGGTSLVMLLAEVGVLLNVSRSMPPAKGD